MVDPELFGYMDDLDPDPEKNPDPEREKNIVPNHGEILFYPREDF